MLKFNKNSQIKKIINSYPQLNGKKITINKSDSSCNIVIELDSRDDFDVKDLEKKLHKELSAELKSEKILIIFNQHKKDKTPQLILICSGKGGVGKSTLCANLARSYHKLGKKVGIVDADIYGPSIHHLFGAEDGVQPKVKDGVMEPLISEGIKFNSMGLIVPKGKALIWRAPMITKSLNNLINQTAWGDLDYIFVDLPPGTGDTHLTLLKNHPNSKAILISASQKLALIDVERSCDMLEKLNIPVLGIIENMAIKNMSHVKDFAKEKKFKYLGALDYNPEIILASDEAKSLLELEDKKISDSLLKIAFDSLTCME